MAVPALRPPDAPTRHRGSVGDDLQAQARPPQTASPWIWVTLEAMGFGRLIALSARGRARLNALRSEDSASRVNDAEFEPMLALVRTSFDLAIDLT